MSRSMKREWLFISCLTTLIAAAYLAFGQQQADPNFDARVANPTYVGRHPKVIFDEAHHNFHTASGRYKPFADLITNDGYLVIRNKEKFTAKALSGYDVLIVANAVADRGWSDYYTYAFTEEECDAVRDWVRRGGSLLLIADHVPYGAAAENLARRFCVEMGKGTIVDRANTDPEMKNPSVLVFSRDNHLLGEHPITRGRNEAERINRVETFTGQSLTAPQGAVAFLKLGETAMDNGAPTEAAILAAIAKAKADAKRAGKPLAGEPEELEVPAGPQVSAAGRAQGVALEFGRGRVVVLGEAAVLSAQVVTGPPAKRLGKDKLLMGMNVPGIDNRQLALNIMHWLSRAVN